MFEQYEHYGWQVWVKRGLRGRHREHCLCWDCSKFTPDDRESNCPLANLVYALCVQAGVVLPVWECPDFRAKVGEG